MAPIHTAAERGDHKHVLKLIQDDDANANLKNVAPPSNADHNFTPPRNFADWTPLHHATWKNHPEVIRALLDSGADLEARTQKQSTALMLAAEHGSTATLILLIERGANVSAENKSQRTALHLAAFKGRVTECRHLVGAGASKEAKNFNGKTPIDEAAAAGREVVVAFLQPPEEVADVPAADNATSPPLPLFEPTTAAATAVATPAAETTPPAEQQHTTADGTARAAALARLPEPLLPLMSPEEQQSSHQSTASMYSSSLSPVPLETSRHSSTVPEGNNKTNRSASNEPSRSSLLSPRAVSMPVLEEEDTTDDDDYSFTGLHLRRRLLGSSRGLGSGSSSGSVSRSQSDSNLSSNYSSGNGSSSFDNRSSSGRSMSDHAATASNLVDFPRRQFSATDEHSPLPRAPPLPQPSPPVPMSLSAAEARIAKLEAENAQLKKEAAAARDEVERWRSWSASLFNALLLSPESCEGYKRIVRSLLAKVLSSALGGADSHDLEFVDCSFPSSPNNAPHMKFLNQTSPSNSEWAIEFAPSGWTVEAKCSARRAGVRYTVQLKVTNLELKGRMRIALGPTDLSKLQVSFLEPPTVNMALAPSLSAGVLGPQLPLPLWGVIDRAVRGGAENWLTNHVVAPHVYTFNLDKLKRKSELTAEDVQVATAAALEASRRF